MKKVLLLLVGLFVISSLAGAQIISNCNTKPSVTGIFEKASDSGYGLDSLYYMIDPFDSTHTNGVMAMHITFHSATADTTTNLHARFDLGQIGNAVYYPSNGAKFITFWVYLDSAQHIPDSLQIDTYAMNNGNWDWTEDTHFVVDMPKNVWYPLSFPLAEHMAKDKNFDIVTHQFMTGLQLQPHNTKWNGIIYVDNVELIGALPVVISDCNTKASVTGIFEKASDSGYGLDSVYYAIDPHDSLHTNGVMAMHITFHNAIADTTTNLHARFDLGQIGNAVYYPSNGAKFITFWVYLDTAQHIPDSLQIDTYAMNNGNWDWTEDKHFVVDMPKNVWYPLSFPLAAHMAKDKNFDIVNHQFMTGLQLTPNNTKWNGIIYVDNVELLSEKTAVAPAIWDAADFEGSKKQNFYVPSYGAGTLSVIADLKTSNGSYVLQGAVNLANPPRRFAVVRDSIPMQNVAGDSSITSVSFDIYLPNKMPTGGLVKFFVSGGTGDSIAVVDTINTKGLQTNAWNTLWITKLDSLATAGKFNPKKKASIGVVVYYPADTSTWKDNIWFDNLTIYGELFGAELPTGVRTNNAVVKTFELYNNYPNPFNPTTAIKYDVANDSKVLIQVFDILGRTVATLVNEKKTAGSYEVPFNASRFASGVYFYRMTAGSFVKTQKMMLLK